MSKISNPKIELENGMCMNDKDYMTLLLSTIKAMEKNTTVFLTESSNEYLFKKIDTIFDRYKNLQRKVFESMFRKGLYELEAVEETKINNKLKTLNQDLESLDN